MMEDTGTPLFMIGLCCPNLSKIVRDKVKNDMFGARELSVAVVALRISFKLPERRNQAGFCTLDSGCCFICCNG